MINCVSDINVSWFTPEDTIAVTSGASTPTYLTNQVINYLEQLDISDESTHLKPSVEISKIL